MEKFFKLKEQGTTVSTEIVAGITTFFAMAYIIFVNPQTLSQAGIPFGAVFLATIISSVVGTLVMGLFANVPYAQAPGMGLNAFFTYTVVFVLGFSWKEALAMVFLCGLINILITVTKVRKLIIKAIPSELQSAIGGGIGVFIAYIGIKNAGLIQFTLDKGKYAEKDGGTIIGSSSAVPGLVNFDNKAVILALIGIFILLILLILKVKGAILIGIAVTTIIGIPMGVVDVSNLQGSTGLGDSFKDLGKVFGAALGSEGIGSLFKDLSRLPLVLMTIFAFSLSDTFDTIGTFVGTGKRSGIFDAEDEKALQEGNGFKSKMDKALFADSIATSIGAIFGTSNTTTYVESAAGIGAGGRTGLTSVVTALLFLLSIFLGPIVNIVPAQATAPALIAVGIMMMSSFKEIDWSNLDVAIPAFFASIFMGFSYSISYGIAAGFIFYCIVKVCQGKAKEVHPIMWITSALFILNFIVLARL
ncbi:putative MFS transporter, AGZA family, xanthine/uracil permease [Anaerocolumna jejuensis DSM 15929]|uniref:Putative MFS transporter, AGZA family, xanthine/uracil permease n=1 Tax=Anaerocolumna jejuensis DSM 15929 TaxID=1121322 RepID=A0A1M7AYM0_9FIRM|nr:NCS2 family permease [Anaerocolumna jejuensis]SHL47842.1 putative MFS transporter, AGZA family, xanthine/uracil permease [Anaerocolumna jejuensis DSM 15929]